MFYSDLAEHDTQDDGLLREVRLTTCCSGAIALFGGMVWLPLGQWLALRTDLFLAFLLISKIELVAIDNDLLISG